MAEVAAEYYDGHSARPHRVSLALDDGRLSVVGDYIQRHEPLADLHVSEPMGAAPRLVKFPDGAHCEVHDHAGFAALLASSGHRDGLVVRLQRRWGWALVAVVVAMAGVAAGYRWGLPALAEWLAFQIPERITAQLGGQTLDLLDQSLFSPSKLPAERRQALAARFDDLATPGVARPAHRILYRDGTHIGANAFALPDGSIVVTDQLVELAGDDEEILAVLAHELGHLERRHSLRMLVQSSIVAIVVAWYIGDVSNVAAGLPTLLIEAGYSRDHEREADQYATALLRFNGLSPARLADMLAKLESAHDEGEDAEGTGGSAFDYLSSHPATRKRIESLRGDVR